MTRHGVVAQLARRTWGLELGLLRGTRSALLPSLARYGLVTFGAFAHQGVINRLETQYANVAARRIAGVSRSAHLEVLHPVAGVTSVRNLLLRLRVDGGQSLTSHQQFTSGEGGAICGSDGSGKQMGGGGAVRTDE